MREFQNPDPARSRGTVIALLAASVVCLLGGALLDGTLGGGLGLGFGSAGFAGYLFLFARAFNVRRSGARRSADFSAFH